MNQDFLLLLMKWRLLWKHLEVAALKKENEFLRTENEKQAKKYKRVK
ncbi:hypothetical protein LCGC14_2693270, partial [marine sediment metagenome]